MIEELGEILWKSHEDTVFCWPLKEIWVSRGCEDCPAYFERNERSDNCAIMDDETRCWGGEVFKKDPPEKYYYEIMATNGGKIISKRRHPIKVMAGCPLITENGELQVVAIIPNFKREEK